MSDIKMSNVFELPVKGGDFLLVALSKSTSVKSDDYAHVAINAYDANQEEIAELKSALKLAINKPMQPLIDGRFKENKIVSHCLDAGGTDMNKIAVMDFTVEDREQFAQLIGYSLGGYSDLSYVTDETYYRAEKLREQKS